MEKIIEKYPSKYGRNSTSSSKGMMAKTKFKIL
jgi:hypothetical protein